MKKVYFLFASLLISAAVHAQCSVVPSNVQNVSCNGMCDGAASVTGVGLPPFTFSWAPGGQTIQNPIDLCPGTHTVTMTDANSCQSTATITITEPASLAVQMTVNSVTCNGACDGDATAGVSGGTSPYQYAWDSTAANQITATATNLCAGTYSVVVTDANGCTTSQMASVTEPAALTVATSSTPTTCQPCTDGSATATVSGGTPSYSYLWAPGGQTTQTATNLSAGSYTVTVTDAQGCTIMDTVVVNMPTGITVVGESGTLSVYPNPIVDIANVDVGSLNGNSIQISIYDATGRTINSKQFSVPAGGIIQWSFENYPSGIYLMEVVSDEAKTTVRLLKQ